MYLIQGYYYAWKTRTQGDLTDFAPLTRVNAHSKYITKCVLSPDNKLLATCSADHTVKIWDASTHQFNLQKTLNGHQRWVWDCAFSADSAYLVTGTILFIQALLIILPDYGIYHLVKLLDTIMAILKQLLQSHYMTLALFNILLFSII